MGNLRDHAVRELAAIGGDDCEVQAAINAGILAIVDVFAEQGHSGTTAPYTIGILTKLLRLEPLTPLTGEDSEWSQVDDEVWQNNRCSHVFKDCIDGPAYDIQGIIWRDPDGAHFTNRESRVEVVFPYTPASEVRDRRDDDREPGR